MTSRERVQAAIHFRKPDRVPIDLGAIGGSGIHATPYDRLKHHVGIHSPTKVRTARNMLAEVEIDLLDRFHCDVLAADCACAAWSQQPASAGHLNRLNTDCDLRFSPTTNIRPDGRGGWFLCNAAGEPLAFMPKDGFYFDFLKSPLSGEAINPDKFRPSPDVRDEDLDAFARRVRWIYEATDKAVFGWGSGVSFFGLSLQLTDNITQGSLDEWLVMLMTERATAHEMMARSVDAAIERTRKFNQAAGDMIDVWGVASDDAGTQRAPFIAPELFREMIAPHYKRLCDWIHKNTRWRTFLHSCGSIYEYIGPWIEAGIDILNPVQISAANMQPEKLMKEFGGRVVFWGGGCETQRVLPTGTPAEIRQHVRRNMDVFSTSGSGQGGFVFTQVHNIQPNVPVENIVAMLDAAYELGGE